MAPDSFFSPFQSPGTTSRIYTLEKQIKDGLRLQESLEERLQFEKLLSDISSEYANLPASDVDKTINSGLQRIGRFLGGDRCNFSLLTENQKTVRVLYSWAEEGIDPLPDLLVNTRNYFSWSLDQVLSAKVIQFTHIEELPDEAEPDKTTLQKFGILSEIVIPISIGRVIVGAFSIDTVRSHRTWPEELAQRLRLLGEIFANALVRKQREVEMQDAFTEIRKLKDQFEADFTYLREEIVEYRSHNMSGQSDAIRHVFSKIQQIAPTDATVLVLGETGTGKELVASAIHAASRHKNRPMVKVNCAALPAGLIESELFGHEKGAFTSAQARQVGRFELAHGTTIFLDEIGELPLESQAKLLRVLQEGEFERLGSSSTIKVDVRIIAATNRDLEEEVRKGRFRRDLWYRVNVFPIVVPPLRDRADDISLLVNAFVTKFSRKLGKKINRIPTNVMNALQSYDWPGNVRELENVIERAVITTAGSSLRLLDTLKNSHAGDVSAQRHMTLEENERNYILQTLEKTKGRLTGPKGAAAMLGINPSTLRGRMRKLGIQRTTNFD